MHIITCTQANVPSMRMIVSQSICFCRSFGKLYINWRIPMSLFEWRKIRMKQQCKKKNC